MGIEPTSEAWEALNISHLDLSALDFFDRGSLLATIREDQRIFLLG